jgi:hypothetical protein
MQCVPPCGSRGPHPGEQLWSPNRAPPIWRGPEVGAGQGRGQNHNHSHSFFPLRPQ